MAQNGNNANDLECDYIERMQALDFKLTELVNERTHSIDLKMTELLADRRESRLERIRIRESIDCLKSGLEEWRDYFDKNYKEYLDKSVQSDKDWQKIFAEFKHGAILKGLYLGLGLLAIGFMLGLSEHWHKLLDYFKHSG
jgi:hypothetical protein